MTIVVAIQHIEKRYSLMSALGDKLLELSEFMLEPRCGGRIDA